MKKTAGDHTEGLKGAAGDLQKGTQDMAEQLGGLTGSKNKE